MKNILFSLTLFVTLFSMSAFADEVSFTGREYMFLSRHQKPNNEGAAWDFANFDLNNQSRVIVYFWNVNTNANGYSQPAFYWSEDREVLACKVPAGTWTNCLVFRRDMGSTTMGGHWNQSDDFTMESGKNFLTTTVGGPRAHWEVYVPPFYLNGEKKNGGSWPGVNWTYGGGGYTAVGSTTMSLTAGQYEFKLNPRYIYGGWEHQLNCYDTDQARSNLILTRGENGNGDTRIHFELQQDCDVTIAFDGYGVTVNSACLPDPVDPVDPDPIDPDDLPHVAFNATEYYLSGDFTRNSPSEGWAFPTGYRVQQVDAYTGVVTIRINPEDGGRGHFHEDGTYERITRFKIVKQWYNKDAGEHVSMVPGIKEKEITSRDVDEAQSNYIRKNDWETVDNRICVGIKYWYDITFTIWKTSDGYMHVKINQVPIFINPMDIVDWSTTSVTVNTNGYSSPTAGAGWRMRVNGTSYNKNARLADRTLEMPYASGLTADKEVCIVVYGTDQEYPESYVYYRIPHIYEGNRTLSGGVDAECMLYVKSGTLTINGNVTVGKVWVAPDAELRIAAGATLTADSLVLRTKAFHPSVLTNSGTLVCNNVFYTRIVADKTQSYELGLPFSAEPQDVLLSNGKNAQYGTLWGLEYWDGQRRSEEGWGGNWIGMPKGSATLNGMQGYQIMSSSAYYYEFYFPVTYHLEGSVSIPVKAYGSGVAPLEDMGWNFVCSPYTHVMPCSASGNPEDMLKISRLDGDNWTFYQYVPTAIWPATPFYYQAEADGELSFDGNLSYRAAAPAKAPNAQEQVASQWIRLFLSDGTEQDETNFYLHPTRFSADYEVGRDLTKLSTDGLHPCIYSHVGDYDLAFTAVPDSMAEEGIALVAAVPQDSTYTFRLEPTEWMDRLEHVYLLDNLTGERTDLLMNDYSCLLPQGTTSGRLMLQVVFRSAEHTTALSETDERADRWTKVIYNGHLYIRRGEHIYNAMGGLMR